MRKKTIPLLALVIFMLLTTAWLTINSKLVYAQSSSALNVNVNHMITVFDGGQITISDAIELSKKQGEPPPISNFNVGFPYRYGLNLDYVFAYESPNPDNKMAVDLNYGLGQIGFYAVRVNFGKSINLNTIGSYNFTVVFVLSNLISEAQSTFGFQFPVYPSLALNASSCKTTVILPATANFTESSPTFNQTTKGILSLPIKQPLDAFSLDSGVILFRASGTFSLLEANEVKRDIIVDEGGTLSVSDSYSITNKAVDEPSNIAVPVPMDASNVAAQDDLGNTLTVSLEKGATAKALVTLKNALKQDDTAYVQVTYGLPLKNYVVQSGWNIFDFKFSVYEPMNLTIRKLTVTINLPEGASFQSSNMSTQPNVIENGVYEEATVFTQNNITSFQNLNAAITYVRSVFWAAFRPTLWTGAVVLALGVITFLWQLQRTPTPITTTLPIRPEELQSFVKTYDEKRKLQQERDSLEDQAKKGRIPRRLYRVRSRTLDSRLAVVSRDLANLRDKIHAAGTQYREMMRQVEIAETELQGVEADIRRTEARYKRGEISASAYHKLLEDSYKRRDRAKTNIDGVLLRLKEEVT